MNTRITVAALLHVSQEMERMTEDIRGLVKLLTRFTPCIMSIFYEDDDDVVLSETEGGPTWRLLFLPEERRLEFRADFPSDAEYLYEYSLSSLETIKPEHLRAMHASLPKLLVGLYGRCPELKASLLACLSLSE